MCFALPAALLVVERTLDCSTRHSAERAIAASCQASQWPSAPKAEAGLAPPFYNSSLSEIALGSAISMSHALGPEHFREQTNEPSRVHAVRVEVGVEDSHRNAGTTRIRHQCM